MTRVGPATSTHMGVKSCSLLLSAWPLVLYIYSKYTTGILLTTCPLPNLDFWHPFWNTDMFSLFNPSSIFLRNSAFINNHVKVWIPSTVELKVAWVSAGTPLGSTELFSSSIWRVSVVRSSSVGFTLGMMIYSSSKNKRASQETAFGELEVGIG